MSDNAMPFGKHKGTPLTEVPIGYLRWCLENLKLKGAIKRQIIARVTGKPAAPEAPQTTPWMGNAVVERSDECPF